jgi:heteromeric Ino2p/Ino4p transcription factor
MIPNELKSESSQGTINPADSSKNGINKPKGTRKRSSILTQDQKKKHHIESEHKRRQAIRDAFQKLVDIVPGLEPSDLRSEALILNKSTEYLTELYEQYLQLVERLKAQNVEVDDTLKLTVPDSVVMKGRS